NGANLSGIKPAIDAALLTSSINDNANLISEYKILTNYSENKATLIYNLSKNTVVNFEVYDITGKKIKSLSFGEQLIGEHEILISLNELASGLSIFKIITDTGFKSIKFLNVY
ncbi:MAG TPA: T9SS type A sorting domain-containing protein, partial [Bacteroidales bacterium]|nr:T9SS type A sorting domain-containing protein [Bacteroidales bacterium]